MDTIRIQQVITEDGEVRLSGLPYKKGESVEIILLSQHESVAPLTVGKFRSSGLIGVWQDREDLGDSPAYARQLREQAENGCSATSTNRV